MKVDTHTLLIGLIVVVLVVNTGAIFFIFFNNSSHTADQGKNGSASTADNFSISAAGTTGSDAGNSTSSTSAGKPATAKSNVTAKPSVKATATPKKTPTPKQYVTIETLKPTPTGTIVLLQPNLPNDDLDASYITIYSLSNQVVAGRLPHVSFNLVNPPLVLEYVFTPVNITDVKYLEWKSINKTQHVNLSVDRPNEDAWFRVNVVDVNTGELVATDCYGKQCVYRIEHEVNILKAGLYEFQFEGYSGNVSMNMSVKKKGNIK
jgi:hypothetical protein